VVLCLSRAFGPSHKQLGGNQFKSGEKFPLPAMKLLLKAADFTPQLVQLRLKARPGLHDHLAGNPVPALGKGPDFSKCFWPESGQLEQTGIRNLRQLGRRRASPAELLQYAFLDPLAEALDRKKVVPLHDFFYFLDCACVTIARVFYYDMTAILRIQRSTHKYSV